MKPVDQTIFGPNTGNCFAACVASILEMRLDDVPNFCAVETDWWGEFIRWLEARDMTALYIMAQNGVATIYGDIHYIGSGQSPRFDCLHATVQLNGKLIHDPHPERTGLAGPVSDMVVLIRRVG